MIVHVGLVFGKELKVTGNWTQSLFTGRHWLCAWEGTQSHQELDPVIVHCWALALYLGRNSKLQGNGPSHCSLVDVGLVLGKELKVTRNLTQSLFTGRHWLFAWEGTQSHQELDPVIVQWWVLALYLGRNSKSPGTLPIQCSVVGVGLVLGKELKVIRNLTQSLFTGRRWPCAWEGTQSHQELDKVIIQWWALALYLGRNSKSSGT